MSVNQYCKIKWMEIKKETIITSEDTREFCKRKYPNRPNGCPSYDKCTALNIPRFEVIDECGGYTHYYVVYCMFDRKGYRESKAGMDNIRWWQGSLKAQLKNKIVEVRKLNKNIFYVYGCGSELKLGFQRCASMEWCGINVFSTMKLNGIKLSLQPKDMVIMVCLLSSIGELKFESDSLERWLK